MIQLLQSVFVSVRDVIPVRNFKYGFDVIRTYVFVLEIVCVLPNVDTEEGNQTWKTKEAESISELHSKF